MILPRYTAYKRAIRYTDFDTDLRNLIIRYKLKAASVDYSFRWLDIINFDKIYVVFK